MDAMTLPLAAISGFLLAMPWLWLLLGVAALALGLGFAAAPIAAWTVAGAVLVLGTLRMELARGLSRGHGRVQRRPRSA